ncbi:hypothetical protein SAMN05216391_108125 [Lachnospiraceae bacterium KHCPX20]|nr:hypothetical protein SAMN05216391_108125 [Lachnospiraceae bacterium KHCPX20]
MVLQDFVFGEKALSDFNCAIGFGETSQGASQTLGNSLSLDTVRVGDNFVITSSKYNEPLSVSFDIIKNPCKFEDVAFTEIEIETIMNWLNSHQYKTFVPIYTDDNGLSNIYFRGSFTSISAIKYSENINGLSVVFTADAPYGYGIEEDYEFSFPSEDSFLIVNDSNETGYLYPKEVTITCKADGDIILYNDQDPSDRKTRINNCVKGEVITIDCFHKIITSSVNHEKLPNDFNYIFPRLNQVEMETDNIFTLDTTALPSADMTLTYSPIRKVGVLL